MIKNLEEKDSDLKDWEKFLEEPGNIHNKDNDETIVLKSDNCLLYTSDAADE